MPGKAAKVQVTERQMDLLEEIVASRTAAVRLVQRAQIVLLAFRKHNNEEVGELVGLNPQQVSVWRKRWKADWERLIAVECNESRSVLKKEIESLLADQPRKGRTPTFSSNNKPRSSLWLAKIPTMNRSDPSGSLRFARYSRR